MAKNLLTTWPNSPTPRFAAAGPCSCASFSPPLKTRTAGRAVSSRDRTASGMREASTINTRGASGRRLSSWREDNIVVASSSAFEACGPAQMPNTRASSVCTATSTSSAPPGCTDALPPPPAAAAAPPSWKALAAKSSSSSRVTKPSNRPTSKPPLKKRTVGKPSMPRADALPGFASLSIRSTFGASSSDEPRRCSDKLSSVGSSNLQGPHHCAYTSKTIGAPVRTASSKSFAFTSWTLLPAEAERQMAGPRLGRLTAAPCARRPAARGRRLPDAQNNEGCVILIVTSAAATMAANVWARTRGLSRGCDIGPRLLAHALALEAGRSANRGWR
mmetsp:Transcript_44029/g.126107  ORF Transcript_44029/g.126107 Transcript_44029/m.126107 type:complete len:332 (-) Transcript_44029:37-1032(-)